MQHLAPGRPDLAGLERRELEVLLQEQGVEPFRARQLYRWVFKRGVVDFEAMTDLSKGLREQLAGRFVVGAAGWSTATGRPTAP